MFAFGLVCGYKEEFPNRQMSHVPIRVNGMIYAIATVTSTSWKNKNVNSPYHKTLSA